MNLVGTLPRIVFPRAMLPLVGALLACASAADQQCTSNAHTDAHLFEPLPGAGAGNTDFDSGEGYAGRMTTHFGNRL